MSSALSSASDTVEARVSTLWRSVASAGRRRGEDQRAAEVVLRAEGRDEHAGGDAAGGRGARGRWGRRVSTDVSASSVQPVDQRRGHPSIDDRGADRGLGVLADGVEHPQGLPAAWAIDDPQARAGRRPGATTARSVARCMA